MATQKCITLNLTKQEAECIELVLKEWRKDYHVQYAEVKPCMPFIDRLQAKIITALNKKPQ